MTLMTRRTRRQLSNWNASIFAAALLLPGLSVAAASNATAGSADYQIISGSQAIVPVSVELGQVIVNAYINGRGPFPLIFDTGAEDALTPEAASLLGLKPEGAGSALDSGGAQISVSYTRVRVIRIGDAEMVDQRFAVLPLSRTLTDRGNRPPVAGLLGYELLARFAVRLNYQAATLTLNAEPALQYGGSGVRVPLNLAGKTAALSGAVDGIAAKFVIDTGSLGALSLRRGFVRERGLDTRHPSGLRIQSQSATGPFEAVLTRLDSFEIADSRIDRPAMRYSPSDAAGFSATDVDGSVGYEILRQFVLTFDYPHGAVWFERSSAFGAKTGQGAAGFQAVKSAGGGLNVTTVLPNTAAAAAGMQVGDQITEIDGRSTIPMSLSEFAALIRQPVGSIVHLDTIRDGIKRPVTLKLRDVLP